MRLPLSMTRSAAVASAPPPTTALRLPKVPVPCWLTWVSPCSTVTWSMLVCIRLAAICAQEVSWPCPWELDPVSTVISPVRSTRTLPLSKPAPPLGSTKVEKPTPTSSPFLRRASRWRNSSS